MKAFSTAHFISLLVLDKVIFEGLKVRRLRLSITCQRLFTFCLWHEIWIRVCNQFWCLNNIVFWCVILREKGVLSETFGRNSLTFERTLLLFLYNWYGFVRICMLSFNFRASLLVCQFVGSDQLLHILEPIIFSILTQLCFTSPSHISLLLIILRDQFAAKIF